MWWCRVICDLECSRRASQNPAMRCYSVLLDAKLTYRFLPKDGVDQPRGYVAVRYVFANNPADAFCKAQRLERRQLGKEWSAISDGSISASFSHEEIEIAPIWRLLRRQYGRSFYMTE